MFAGNGHFLSGNGSYRCFFVPAGTTQLANLTIQDTKTQGGNGGCGLTNSGIGGGGAGLGGAVFVNSGANFSMDGVTLLRNVAVGGSGGSSDCFSGCALTGGDGLGGNGGNISSTTGGSGGVAFAGLGAGGAGGNSAPRGLRAATDFHSLIAECARSSRQQVGRRLGQSQQLARQSQNGGVSRFCRADDKWKPHVGMVYSSRGAVEKTIRCAHNTSSKLLFHKLFFLVSRHWHQIC